MQRVNDEDDDAAWHLQALARALAHHWMADDDDDDDDDADDDSD